jgi:hypothetical protein
MLRYPNFCTIILPLLLALVALIILNFGLYQWLLAPIQADESAFSLPYTEDFSDPESPGYAMWGGDWELRDQTFVQLNTTGYDLGAIVPLKIAAEQAYQFSVNMRYLGGSMGGGVLVNVQQETSRQKSHLVRFNVDNGKLYLIYGYFGDDSNFTGQGSVELSIDPANADWHSLTVRVSGSAYAFSVDDQELATGIPLQYHGGSVGLVTSASQVAFDDLSVTAIDASAVPTQSVIAAQQITPVPRVDAVAVDPFSEIFADTFTGGNGENTNWVTYAGTWSFEPGAFIQTDTDGFDFGVGSLETYNNPIRLQVTFSHQNGVGGGILFNMPQADSKNGAYMVRYVDDTTLTWGYFDSTGVFVGQGGVGVDAPGTSAHTLQITTRAGSYAITLDGRVVAQDIPVSSSGGHIGLTASQSAVAFTSVVVESADGMRTPEAPSGTTVILNSITGNWTSDSGVFTQTEDVQADSVAGVGVSAATFRISVDITLPTAVDDAGGGLVFHMDGRGDLANGTMVRFGSGGRQIFWGRYDSERTFTGEGSSELALTAGQPYTLTLIVRPGDYDILIDGEAVATSIPLATSRGWIGLISFRGPVDFRNVELSLGGA